MYPVNLSIPRAGKTATSYLLRPKESKLASSEAKITSARPTSSPQELAQLQRNLIYLQELVSRQIKVMDKAIQAGALTTAVATLIEIPWGFAEVASGLGPLFYALTSGVESINEGNYTINSTIMRKRLYEMRSEVTNLLVQVNHNITPKPQTDMQATLLRIAAQKDPEGLRKLFEIPSSARTDKQIAWLQFAVAGMMATLFARKMMGKQDRVIQWLSNNPASRLFHRVKEGALSALPEKIKQPTELGLLATLMLWTANLKKKLIPDIFSDSVRNSTENLAVANEICAVEAATQLSTARTPQQLLGKTANSLEEMAPMLSKVLRIPLSGLTQSAYCIWSSSTLAYQSLRTLLPQLFKLGGLTMVGQPS